jgi:hypothetical protein
MNQAKRNQWPIPKLISRAIIKDLILTKAVIFFPFLKRINTRLQKERKKEKKGGSPEGKTERARNHSRKVDSVGATGQTTSSFL